MRFLPHEEAEVGGQPWGPGKLLHMFQMAYQLESHAECAHLRISHEMSDVIECQSDKNIECQKCDADRKGHEHSEGDDRKRSCPQILA